MNSTQLWLYVWHCTHSRHYGLMSDRELVSTAFDTFCIFGLCIRTMLYPYVSVLNKILRQKYQRTQNESDARRKWRENAKLQTSLRAKIPREAIGNELHEQFDTRISIDHWNNFSKHSPTIRSITIDGIKWNSRRIFDLNESVEAFQRRRSHLSVHLVYAFRRTWHHSRDAVLLSILET